MVVSLSSVAQEKYVCTHGTAERVIFVKYLDEPNKVPCEVHYAKAEGEQVLWSAENTEGYCEEKAAAFVDKQSGWGWTCAAE
jgi:hypothetical protein